MLVLLSLSGAAARAEEPPQPSSCPTDVSAGDETYCYLLDFWQSFQGIEEPFPGPRTGTNGGFRTHQWLEATLRSFGIEARQDTWTFPRYVPDAFSLSVETPDGGVFEPAAFPWFYQGTTGPEPVMAELVYVGPEGGLDALDLSGKIALVDGVSPGNNATSAPLQRARNALAVVVAIDGPANSIVGTNTTATAAMGEQPTLIVGELDGRRLKELSGQTATFLLDARIVEGTARNTLAAIPGEDPSNLVVVDTPVNGLFHVATERGGGVAAFVHLARWFADRARSGYPPAYTILFAATGGHEVAAGGLERFLDETCNDDIVTLFHLGAGLAMELHLDVGGEIVDTDLPEWFRGVYVSENPLLLSTALRRFGPRVVESPHGPVDPGAAAIGEQRVAYAQGIPLISNQGAGLYHHTMDDTPDKTSAELLEPMVLGYRESITDVLGMDADEVRLANTVPGLRGSGTCPR